MRVKRKRWRVRKAWKNVFLEQEYTPDPDPNPNANPNPNSNHSLPRAGISLDVKLVLRQENGAEPGTGELVMTPRPRDIQAMFDTLILETTQCLNGITKIGAKVMSGLTGCEEANQSLNNPEIL